MKSNEVMKILNISRSTLYNYTKNNTISCVKLENGYYNYDESSVLAFIKKDPRINVIYTRVSTNKQKGDLERQINKITKYCKDNNIKIDNIYSEISSGIDLDRPLINKLIDDIINLKIKKVIISNKDRLTRLSFKTLEFLFSKFKTEIVVIADDGNKSNDNEIFEELISLMHVFSTTMYSNRRKNKINIFKQDIENFISEDN